MRVLLFVALIFAAFSARAEDGAKAVVWLRHSAAVPSEFKGPQYKLLNPASEAQDLRDSGYLPPGRRNAVFHRLKLDEKVKALDEMDKDILVINARFEDVEWLKKWFPGFSATELSALKEAVNKEAQR